MLKELFKEAREERERNENLRNIKDYPALSVALFDSSKVFSLSKEELRILLQEAIYLLRDKSKEAEEELIQAVEEWHGNELE